MRSSSVICLNGDDGGLIRLTLILVGVVGGLRGVPCLGVVYGGCSLSSSHVRHLEDGGVVETLVLPFHLGVAVVCEFEVHPVPSPRFLPILL